MNLPASTPQVELREGQEWLVFTYSTKGHIQEYCIHIDIDNIRIEDIPEDFRNDNCVYPRALAPRESYQGNRYDYETSVNDLAWKLTWLNASVLAGKRGLIQRAVDSYRNRTPESRSRRVLRQEKLHNGALRRRTMDSVSDLSIEHRQLPKTITMHFNANGESQKAKIRVDVENVNVEEMDEDFRRNNSIYPQQDVSEPECVYSETRHVYEIASNELAWKLAWLNTSRLAGKKAILQKAVDAYRCRFEGDASNRTYAGSVCSGGEEHHRLEMGEDDLAAAMLDKNEEFSEMVAHTLQQALSQDDLDVHSQVSLEDHLATAHGIHNHDDDDDDDEDEQPQTVSTAELMRPGLI